MLLSHLHIQHLRNLSDVNILPGPRLNCLMGANGSGKTSVLEAIYLLGLGRSFRSSQLNRVIQQEMDELLVFAEIADVDYSAVPQKLGFSRSANKTRIRLNGEPLDTIADLAQLLPILLLYSESYALFRDSPRARRKWLDWGMFHVEPLFFPLWKKLQRVLQHRNALLKQGCSENDVTVWDLQLVEIAESIHELRLQFMEQWQRVFQSLLPSLFDRQDIFLIYTPGWDVQQSLSLILKRSFGKDRALGYTSSGPQRADIQVYIEGVPAQHILSLGQQKLLVSGIILSQAIVVRTLANKTPILLIDDLPAELDSEARQRIARIIHSLEAQIFLTGIDQHTLAPFVKTDQTVKMFHVERGEIIII